MANGIFPGDRLIRAGLSGAAVAVLAAQYAVMSDADGAAYRKWVTAHSDSYLFVYYTGSPPIAPPNPDPYPQYLPRSEASAVAASRVPKDTLTIDARDHGVTGDGVTDDTANLIATLALCPEGGEVLLRPGTYIVSSPIILRRNRSLRGLHSGIWPYDTGGPVRIKASLAFTGDAVIRMRDEEDLYGSVGAPANGLYVGPNDQSGQSITQLTIDGFNVPGAIDGIKASGHVRSVRLSKVVARRCTGTGFRSVAYVRLDGLNYYPRGWRLDQCVADANGNMGFGFNLLNDSTLTDCLAVGNTTNGFYFAGPGELLLIGCRAPFNKARGFYLTGTNYGNTVLSACTTDRNDQSGIVIDCTGRRPITLSGCALRRDGRNGNSGGGGHAGVLVTGSTCPVVLSGVSTETGQDDDATGTPSPQYGVRAVNSTSVVVDSGVIWGATAAVSDGGGNTQFRVSPRVVQLVGGATPVATYAPDTAPFPQPVDQGYLTWAYDVAQAVNTASNALTSGVLTLIKVRLTAPATPAAIAIYIATAGATLTPGSCYAGLYSATGTLLGTSVDQAASWASTGAKTMALTPAAGQSLTLLPPGVYYIGLLGTGGTMPTLLRASGQAAVNQGLAAGSYRFATYGTGQALLPASVTMASQAAVAVATWAALA